MLQALFDFFNQFIIGGNVPSFLVYMLTVAILCAVEQYRYYNEVMQTPIQNSNEIS